MTVARQVWGFIERRDHRLMRRLNRWRAPRWIRYWMIAATRLGDRRAGAVREELISQGVDGSRIQTVSFGLEMPADSGHSESAWAKNRRAEIGVIR